jgi:hypothetical protein
MKVLWASSWGVFAALTDAVHSPRHQCFGKKQAIELRNVG